MDQEMNFPNPVVRTDLPTRKSRWPRVVLAGVVLGALVLVFLPQILSSKVGRRLVVSNIAGKTNGRVTIESFQTSWFGGTTIRFLNISDPMGRGIGAKSITTQASLWNLLRGRYKLGECVVEGLHFEYVVDDGRGSDTFDLMKAPPPGQAPPPPQTIQARLLPNLSGRITIKGGTLVLHRGTVQPGLYNTTWQQGRLENVDAKFEIDSLDKPWTYSFIADSVEGDQPRGMITSSGTVDLGESQVFDPRQLKVDCTLSGENVRTGGLGAALVPESTPEDLRQAMGPVLAKVDLAVKAKDGRLVFERCEAQGNVARVLVRPAIDLTATPNVLALDSASGEISLGISKRLADGVLVFLNPFFREAVGGQGVVTLNLEQFRLPLAGPREKLLEAKGRVKAQGVSLKRNDDMKVDADVPDNLASQLALLTGGTAATVPLDVDGPFAVAQGVVAQGPMTTTVGDTTVSLEGRTEIPTGAIQAWATLVKSPSITSHLQGGAANFAIPLAGTIRQPKLGVLNYRGEVAEAARRSLGEQVTRQVARMRAKEAQRQMEKSQRQVQDILRPLEPLPDTPKK